MFHLYVREINAYNQLYYKLSINGMTLTPVTYILLLAFKNFIQNMLVSKFREFFL